MKGSVRMKKLKDLFNQKERDYIKLKNFKQKYDRMKERKG